MCSPYSGTLLFIFLDTEAPCGVERVYKEILPLSIILLMFAIAFYAGPLVQTNPNGEMISHWNFSGQPDGYISKPVGLYLLPVLALVIYAGLLLIPRIEVYQDNFAEFSQQFWGFKVILVFVMGVIYIASLLPNMGYWTAGDPLIIIVPAVSMLFFYVGYMLNFTKRNYFIGIHTPWTLADEKVWEKTNRLGGKMFWVCGALALVSLVSPADLRLWIVLLPVVLTAIAASVYSLLEYRKTKQMHEAKRGRK
jgi:uncharacterized membrane protein